MLVLLASLFSVKAKLVRGERLINVLLAADFPLEKTGIISTATGLLKGMNGVHLFCDQKISVGDVHALPMPLTLKNSAKVIIFTHLEFSGLKQLISQFPDATVHVGDWPGTYWKSVATHESKMKARLGYARTKFRLRNLPRNTRFLFVTERDMKAAVKAGFCRSRHLPIGVDGPKRKLAKDFDPKTLCFSGNFRFKPNAEAARRLIKWASAHKDYKVQLAGFFANDFSGKIPDNVEIFDSVPSVVEFLAERRPVYVSLVRLGAGAKNKILEALSCGCPVIATRESLDSSFAHYDEIEALNTVDDLSKKLRALNNRADVFNRATLWRASDIAENRTWGKSSNVLQELAND